MENYQSKESPPWKTMRNEQRSRLLHCQNGEQSGRRQSQYHYKKTEHYSSKPLEGELLSTKLKASTWDILPSCLAGFKIAIHVWIVSSSLSAFITPNTNTISSNYNISSQVNSVASQWNLPIFFVRISEESTKNCIEDMKLYAVWAT